jgi:predicted nucleotide-binding protein
MGKQDSIKAMISEGENMKRLRTPTSGYKSFKNSVRSFIMTCGDLDLKEYDEIVRVNDNANEDVRVTHGSVLGYLKGLLVKYPDDSEPSKETPITHSNTELDIEVLDAGNAYTLYSMALVSLAIGMNKGEDLGKKRNEVNKYADQLHGALVRCGIDKEIPREFSDSGQILAFLQTQVLLYEITNLLVRQHSRRQENIFIFTILLGGVLSGEVGGVDDATSAARTQIPMVSQTLELPDKVAEQCLQQRSLGPFRDYLANAHPAPARKTTTGDQVFLVHGHNEAITQEVARFLERLAVKVTILREQPNSGRTIIEKFMDYSNVAFAVVLLTGDDRGGKSTDQYKEQKPRARQNVIFELGFFIGKLGRNRVCALFQEAVDIPSDYAGVLFVPIDAGGAWRLSLTREMKEAGLTIDLNKAV